MSDSRQPFSPIGRNDLGRQADSEGYLGRRVEEDGSWTMYHVFTGVPARVDNRMTTGLTKQEATAMMVRRNADSTIK